MLSALCARLLELLPLQPAFEPPIAAPSWAAVLPLTGVDAWVERFFAPVARGVSAVVFYGIPVGSTTLPLIVVWLIAGAVWFTWSLRFINLRGFAHGVRIVCGREEAQASGERGSAGEVSHFQALSAAVSGTVGVGNIAAVAILVSVAGPGATFWMIVAGLLGMSTKFAECTLGVKFRSENEDGSVTGGPMFYIDRGLASIGWPRLGRGLALYYATCLMIGCLGIGCMFQANQAYVQVRNISGGEAGFFGRNAWFFGLLLALLVGLVVVGGIRSIASVAGRLVPLMAVLYFAGAAFVLVANLSEIPGALRAIVEGAFTPQGVGGGALAAMVFGFRRAVFSNEAGIGSSSVAHAAVKTSEPVTEGYVAMLEPFIDTVVICTMTSLVILVTVWEPGMNVGQMSGVELTSSAFASVVPWFPLPLAVVVVLFAFSTMIAWAYYGQSAFVYLFGNTAQGKMGFNVAFCLFVVLGCTTQLTSIIDFSDALVFAMALANVLALYFLTPTVKREVVGYWQRRSERPEPARSVPHSS